MQHILKNIRIISENKITAIQISITMFNSQPALGLQIYKNKSGKYPNFYKLLHLQTNIHTILCRLCTFCTLYMHDLYLHFARYWFHGCKCWREIWGGNFKLKQEKYFKCVITFSFDIQRRTRKLRMGRAIKDASLASFLQTVGQQLLRSKVEKIRWWRKDLQTRLRKKLKTRLGHEDESQVWKWVNFQKPTLTNVARFENWLPSFDQSNCNLPLCNFKEKRKKSRVVLRFYGKEMVTWLWIDPICYVLSIVRHQDKYYFNYIWNLKHNRFVIVWLSWMDQVAIVRNLACCQYIKF